MVNELPEQMLPLAALMAGPLCTVTVDTAVLLAGQPPVPVPVTEYEVVEAGDTVKLPPVTV